MVGTDITQTLTNKDLTSGTNTFPTFNQSTTGNAATATKLQTARNIQTNLASTGSASFDGTAAVTPGVTGTLGLQTVVRVQLLSQTANTSRVTVLVPSRLRRLYP